VSPACYPDGTPVMKSTDPSASTTDLFACLGAGLRQPWNPPSWE